MSERSLRISKQQTFRTHLLIQHSFEDFQVVMADLILSDGILVTARSENQINGLAIVYRRDKQLIISELFAETKDAEHSLLHHISNLLDAGT